MEMGSINSENTFRHDLSGLTLFVYVFTGEMWKFFYVLVHDPPCFTFLTFNPIVHDVILIFVP